MKRGHDGLERYLAALDGETPVDGVDLRPALRRRLARRAGGERTGWTFRLATTAALLLAAWTGGRLATAGRATAGEGTLPAGSLLWEETAQTLDILLVTAEATGGVAVAGDSAGAEVTP